ncbi:Site-specific recombinase XerD [Pseudomonas arsenicoxydans]|uniref:Site-specific recombinase XerD n=1 Tax=Pseudomonas arsenicoxydans TaxID=702115 RepID=A0A1H0JXQ7_9PSED|nr:tyrosine-type recombinase/integrase [Pseudomonas arsenicoxydans]SDO48293.1 Site-specific recombinase XerD [Pseudomonas arsenicoxydans]
MKLKLAGDLKLFYPLPNLKLYSHHIDNRIFTKDGSNLPFLVWPDHTPCTAINLYMLTLRDQRGRAGQPLSRRGSKGGTIGDYAGKLSQLIRYCSNEHLDFLELTDLHFTRFISKLRKQRYKDRLIQRQKNENTLTSTGQVCLNFLRFLGNFSGKPNFVAENGVIKTTTREYSIVGHNGQVIKKTSIWHHSFTLGETGDTRNPISPKSVKSLRQAADDANTSSFINSRRHLHISFLEYLGPRRGELADIKVEAINRAWHMKFPVLDLLTLKQGEPVIRQIPVSRVLLQQARTYMKLHRPSAIKIFTKGGRPDHGKLFVSERTGKPLADTTITNEIHTLRKAAGISEQACAHMFRHAFCTNLFVILFQRNKFKNSKEFEIRLISDSFFLHTVKQLSGHKTLEGLMPYIHLAYRRLNNIEETVSIANLILLQDEFDSHLRLLCHELKKGLGTFQFIDRVEELISLKYQDRDDILNK